MIYQTDIEATLRKYTKKINTKLGYAENSEITVERQNDEFVKDRWGYGNGVFIVKKGALTLFQFNLSVLPHCCGICVFSNLQVQSHILNNNSIRGKGIGRYATMFAEDLSKTMGYSIMISADKSSNYTTRIAKKRGFNPLINFTNKRNGNALTFYSKEL
jgi:hypothetical protein